MLYSFEYFTQSKPLKGSIQKLLKNEEKFRKVQNKPKMLCIAYKFLNLDEFQENSQDFNWPFNPTSGGNRWEKCGAPCFFWNIIGILYAIVANITVAKVYIYLAQKETKYKNLDISKITLQCPFLMRVLMKILPCFSLKSAFIIFVQFFSTDVGTWFYI